MGIKITDPESVPALVYEHVHLDELLIEQETMINVNNPPVYKLLIQYRLFAVGPDGKTHFKPKKYYIQTNDYLTEAMKKAATGDLDMIDALKGIEKALTVLIKDQDVHGEAEVN